ncbi:LPS biosynthesis protein [Legionella lansingensis]|uniref:LPS biosynthesis protein n=1 Tax=Legionella lansingensis TaxID=45067 RepID=A0A0W0VW56_9GAMM|nr:N-acetyl sugar amidotransferase [Legionella lansingensis]KTD24307.1 LPS biosynthesis protein [Legionella lansingensis]SNV51841.1 LPS biosynthesis protein [Legionella lansingensis]
MKRCSFCGLPETHETISFDESGVCNICRQQEYKRDCIDWSMNKRALDELIEEHRGKYDYDCIIPFSGGKDSTWTLYYLVKEYNIKPLVVRFDHGFMRPNLEENVKRTARTLGVDIMTFTPNWKVVQKLMLQSFLEKGDFCWHCHTGIFSYPMWVALEKKVPLIFWGERSAEYTAYFSYDQVEEVDEKRFNRYVNLGISADDMFIRLGGQVDIRHLKPYSYPPLKELRALNYRSVCLGSYIPWDVKRQSEIIQQELGWKGDQVENVPPQYQYEKIECYMQGVRDYIKYIKRGYSRPSHLVALDIRHGRLTLEEGKKLIAEYEGRRPPSLDLFLDFIGLTEEEFLDIAMSHQVSPYEHDLEKTQPGKKTSDFDSWSRDGAMFRVDVEEIVARWRASKVREEIA